jgi:hypothetical protein
MANEKMSECCHFVAGIDPVADAFSGTVYSDVVNMTNYGKAVFIVFTGVGTTGTSTFTVEASSTAAAAAVSAVPFHYRSYDASDVPGDLTSCASTGFTSTAGSSRIHVIEIDAEACIASGYKYARLKCVEVANDPVLGGVLIQLCEPRSTENVGATAVV